MPNIPRRHTPTVMIGAIPVGGAHPVVVQSMTDTPTADVQATLRQTLELVDAGAELVRWTINDDAAACGAIDAIARLRALGVTTPVIGDFHFNGHQILTRHDALAQALDKYRINPGNVGRGEGRDANFAAIIRIAVNYGKAVRIGVNWGSLDPALVDERVAENARLPEPADVRSVMRECMLESALASARRAIELGLPSDKLVLSAKLSILQDTVMVYERLAVLCPYALHLGLTEAGGGTRGIVASAAALSILLQQGIGDTVRVSLTPEPGLPRTREVEVCRDILQTMGFRDFSPVVTSCPGCGRTQSVFFQELARDVRNHIAVQLGAWKKSYPGVESLKIAVMGCVVNGPGESAHADIGISLPGGMEEPVAPVYADGRKIAVLKGANIRAEFLDLLEGYISRRFSRPA